MALNIITGKQPRAQKCVIYGSEGIGKSTLASQFPRPLFIDTEGSTAHMDVARVDKPSSWSDLLVIINEVAMSDVCDTLVIDTVDWAEKLCINHVCETNNKEGIESFGYGKGYTYVQEEFSKLLKALDNVIAAGIHVVLTAHAQMRKFEQPDELGAYDRWEMKLSKRVCPDVKEWADMVLFCNYKTNLITAENGAKKAKGGKRVIYTSHHPCWDAKNRHGLPDELDMTFDSIAAAFGKVPKKNPKQDLLDIMKEDGLSAEDMENVTIARDKNPDGLTFDNFTPDLIDWCTRNYTKVKAAAIEIAEKGGLQI